MAIRYDKALSREIARTVRNFNQKVYRLEKIRKELVPERVSVKALKEEFTSRADLERRLRELRGFSTRGAEDIITTKGGVTTTRYEFQLTKERARIAKARVSRQITELGKIRPTVYGKKQAHKFSEMGSEELSNLEARRKSLEKDISKLTPEQFKSYQKRLKAEFASWNSRRGSIFFESYMEILDRAAYMANVPKEQVEYIKNILRKQTLWQFGALMTGESAFKTILDKYKIAKMEAGVLSTEDEEELRDAFQELYENLDEIVEQYHA